MNWRLLLVEVLPGMWVWAMLDLKAHLLREFASSRLLDVRWARVDLPTILARWGPAAGGEAWKRLEEVATKATSKDNLKALAKLTRRGDGQVRFASQPPILEPTGDVYPDVVADRIWKAVSRRYAPTGESSRAAASASSTVTGSWTWLARSSGLAVSGPGAGWRCASAGTTTTRSSSR